MTFGDLNEKWSTLECTQLMKAIEHFSVFFIPLIFFLAPWWVIPPLTPWWARLKAPARRGLCDTFLIPELWQNIPTQIRYSYLCRPLKKFQNWNDEIQCKRARQNFNNIPLYPAWVGSFMRLSFPDPGPLRLSDSRTPPLGYSPAASDASWVPVPGFVLFEKAWWNESNARMLCILRCNAYRYAGTYTGKVSLRYVPCSG